MFVASLPRCHRMNGILLRIVVVFLSQLKGALIEESAVGKDDELAVSSHQHAEGVGRRLTLKHDIRELHQRHADIERAHCRLAIVDRQAECGKRLTVYVGKSLRRSPTHQIGIDSEGIGIPMEMRIDNIGIFIDQPLGIRLHQLWLVNVPQHFPINISRSLFYIEQHIVYTSHCSLEGLGSMADRLFPQCPTREEEHDGEGHDEQDGQSTYHHQTKPEGQGLTDIPYQPRHIITFIPLT